MANNLPEVVVKPRKSSQKLIICLLLFLCLIFAGFTIYAFLSPNSPFNKKTSVIPTNQTELNLREREPGVYYGKDKKQIIFGDNCSKLIIVITSRLGEPVTFKDEFSEKEYKKLATAAGVLSGDANLDGKVDRLDLELVYTKPEDEKFCQEILERGETK